MFGTIRRHQNWLWFIVVAVVIVSFVVYFDPSQRGSSGRGGGGAQLGEIDGKPVTPQQLRDAQQEARLLYFLNFRKWPEQDTERASQMGFDLEREAYLRLLRVAKANEAGIHVSDATVAALAKRLLGDFPLDRFEKEVLLPARVDAVDFERFVRHDAAIQQLSAINGLAGRLIAPAEVEAMYRRDHQELAGEIVLFSISNYLSRVTITNNALTQWYTNQMARYRTPEQMRVSYVEFSGSNFLAEADKQLATVTNLNAQLEQIYYKNGTNAFKDTNGVVLTREKAIEQIKENERSKLAHFFARRKANDFASKVYDMGAQQGDQPIRAELLANVAASEGLQLKVTPPFDLQEGPTNLNLVSVSPQLWTSLSPTNAISFQPLEGENAFYVVAYKDVIPSRLQPFEAVQAKVADDYRRAQALTLIRQEGMAFQARVTNALAQGKTFSEVATGMKLKPTPLPPISRSTETLTNFEETVNVRQLKNVLFSLEPGKSSGFIPNPPDGGYVLYLRAKLPLDESRLKAELPKFMAEMRYYKQNDVFNQWFRRAVEKSAATLPALNRQTTRGGAGPQG